MRLRLRAWLLLCARLRLRHYPRLLLRPRLGLRLWPCLHRRSVPFHLRPCLLLRYDLRSRRRHYPRLTLLTLNLHLRPSRLRLRSHGLHLRCTAAARRFSTP